MSVERPNEEQDALTSRGCQVDGTSGLELVVGRRSGVGMLRFFARMVQRYDEQAATATAERPGFLAGPHSCVTAPTDRAAARRLR
jgi:hypothetical protein